jgi:predicted Zn-dependent peptidase
MMSNRVTVEQVEQLALQLPTSEQLKLVARISTQLSNLMAMITPSGIEQQEREAMADALLAELDAIAESIEGNFDSAEDIRQIREERANRL